MMRHSKKGNWHRLVVLEQLFHIGVVSLPSNMDIPSTSAVVLHNRVVP